MVLDCRVGGCMNDMINRWNKKKKSHLVVVLCGGHDVASMGVIRYMAMADTTLLRFNEGAYGWEQCARRDYDPCYR